MVAGMTKPRPMLSGAVEMVEVYDIETDSMKLAPAALAMHAERLKQEWLDSVPPDLRSMPHAALGDAKLFEKAREASLELMASMKPIPDPLDHPMLAHLRKIEVVR